MKKTKKQIEKPYKVFPLKFHCKEQVDLVNKAFALSHHKTKLDFCLDVLTERATKIIAEKGREN